jgi:serine protease Do
MLGTLLLLGIATVLGLWPGSARTEDLTPREIYERSSPAVVLIIGHSITGQRGSGGTGSIIQQDGLVLTNAHVVIEEQTGRPYPRLTVYMKPDRVTGDLKRDLSRASKARVVAFSQLLDLALLKLDGAPGPLPVLELDDSDKTAIGDRVLAIGHPEQGGLWSLTGGIISAEFENFNAMNGKSVFQTETGLNRGNSGGPLLNTSGRMIGVNTAIVRVAPDGQPVTSISFSLKSNVAKRWLREQRGASQEVRAPSDTPLLDQSAGPSTPLIPLPSRQPIELANPPAVPSPSPAAQPAAQVLTPPRPYNLDRLIDQGSRAEADLEEMINEMRGRFRGR